MIYEWFRSDWGVADWVCWASGAALIGLGGGLGLGALAVAFIR